MKNRLVLSLLVFGMCTVSIAQSTYTCTGHVYHKGKQIMTLQESLVLEGQHYSKKMDYYDMKGKLIVTSKASFFPPNMKTLSYVYEDVRIPYKEGLHLQKNQYVLEHTKKDKERDFKAFEDQRVWLSQMAIVPYMQYHLPELIKGAKLPVDYPVPFLLARVDVIIERVADKKVNHVDCYGIKFEPSSWIFRLLTDANYVYVEKAAPHRLMYYEGILIPTDAKGNMMTGHCFFHYH